MKTVVKLILGLVVAAGVIALAAYQVAHLGAKREQAKPVISQAPVEVKVQKLRPQTIERSLHLTGTTAPLYQIQLASKLSGQLEELFADEGDEVRKGEMLACVDKQSILAQVEQAQASLQVAEASQKQAEANLEKVSQDRQRIRNLFREGSATQEQLDQAETAYKVCQAQKELAAATVADRGAALKLADIRLQDCAIRAPADGVIARKCNLGTKLGEWLDPLCDKLTYLPPLIGFAYKGIISVKLYNVDVTASDVLMNNINP